VADGMDINFQRKIDRFVGVPVCALFSMSTSASETAGRGPTETDPGPPAVGDGSLVLARRCLVSEEPVPGRLHPRHGLRENREVLDLLAVVPETDVLTLNDRSIGAFASDSLGILRRMRSLRFDVVIDCELFARVSSIFSYLSGAPVRVGFHPHTQKAVRGSYINRRSCTIRTGTSPGSSWRWRPRSNPTPIRSPRTRRRPIPSRCPCSISAGGTGGDEERLHADFPAIRGKKLVLVYPSGGILPIRAWPLEHYADSAPRCSRWVRRRDHRSGIRPFVRACHPGRPPSPLCIDLTGYTKSVRELVVLFYRASLADHQRRGPVHFSALAPIPSIVFFRPGDARALRSWRTMPTASSCPLPCSPCLTAYNHRTSPCDGDNRCLNRIDRNRWSQRRG